MSGAPPADVHDETRSVQLTGRAGDILVFDVDLLHAGSRNLSGARRRSMLINYWAEPLYVSHRQTVALRNIHMDPIEWFDPADNILVDTERF